MGLFRRKNGGFMDQIRCDEPSYLIWKWHPQGSEKGNNNRENAIRWGSSLRVKESQVAVFVYNMTDGMTQDFIEGPFDQILETENLPVFADIIGLAYQGGTPFQAEVYFINLAEKIQIPFVVPYFEIYDARFPDIGVPVAVRGTMVFRISDYREFIRIHGLSDFSLKDLQNRMKDVVTGCVKSVVSMIPDEMKIPIVQIDRKVFEISEIIEKCLSERLFRDFGIDVSAIDISSIETDRTSDGYHKLMALTAEKNNSVNVEKT